MKFKEWFGSHTPPNIPRIQDGPIGNELKTDAGQLSKEKAGESGTDKFRDKTAFQTPKTELPAPRMDRSKGLGNLGMSAISKSTFGGEKGRAGQTPTIVHGIPVDGIEGQFK